MTIPVFNESKHIEQVLEDIPSFVDYVIIVDDASTDDTLEKLELYKYDKLIIIKHETNKGVGQSTIDGHNLGVKLGADILVRSDGDGQMNMEFLVSLINPIIEDGIEFAKGNRMSSKEMHKEMSILRLVGNTILTYMTKITTGYWNLRDAQNGFTAIKRDTFLRIKQKSLRKDYRFENSVLFELSLLDSKIVEVDIPAIYIDEVSGINLFTFIPKMITYQVMLFFSKPFRKLALKRKEIN
jgi:glycosyltransferase involved in cell wall biosynthesis